MTVICTIEANNPSCKTFLELFTKREEVFLKELRQLIPRASLYTIVLPKVREINKLVDRLMPEHFFVEVNLSYHKIDGCLRHACKKHSSIRIVRIYGNWYAITSHDEEK